MFTMEKIRQMLSEFGKLNRAIAILLCALLTVTGSVIIGSSVKLIRIVDGTKSYNVPSFSGNITAALNMANLPSDKYRVVSTETVDNTTSVNIEYLFPVYISVGEQTITFDTAKGTVREILTDAGYTVDEYDSVEPSPDTVIEESCYIDYTNIDYVSGSYEEAIKPNTITVKSASLELGKEKLEKGRDGVRQVNYTDKYINGVKTETIINDTIVLSAAVDSKKIIGTKKVNPAVTTSASVNCVSTLTPASPIQLDANGVPVNYTKRITARATAYTYTGNNCSTGVAPQPGYIAVNPDYIPYGTRMYIKTSDGKYIYGYAVAADTGGFIKKHPTGVDLFFTSHSACNAFGVRNVEIYILP